MNEKDFQRLTQAAVSDDRNGLFLKFVGDLAERELLREFAEAAEYWKKAQHERFQFALGRVQAVLLNHFFLRRGVTAEQLHAWSTEFDWSVINRTATIGSHFPIAVSMALDSLRSHASGGPIVLPGSSAYFEFVGVGVPDSFVIKLVDSQKIDHARAILRGQEKSKVHVRGTVVKQPVTYNPPWNFHLDPPSIDFFQLSMEVCDSAMAEIERNLDEVGGAFLPGNHWCPWDSTLTRELTF